MPTRSDPLIAARRRALRKWFGISGRDLPWRNTRDAWLVLLAEVMLQQTQVTRVAERWDAVVQQFGSPRAMHDAGQASVVRAWAGLGYNRRAVSLYRCSTQIVERHGGLVPDDRRALEALDGIGPYTSRAVLAFAFERDVGVVDTNVGRVLARWQGRSLSAGEAQSVADAHVVRRGAWWWNQAMLDLGALVCTRRSPRCAACPVRRTCAWALTGQQGEDPAGGSAGVSVPQSRFEGSDRQGRGRVVAALRDGPVPDQRHVLAAAAGWPGDAARAMRVVDGLVRDGLVQRTGGHLRLSGDA